MKDKPPLVLWLNEIGKEDIPHAGGKGANLGEMIRAGIPVPPGFVVSSEAYYYFLEQAKLEDVIRKFLEALDPENSEKLHIAADGVKRLITRAKMPPEVAEAIREAYQKMGHPPVAVRSSATAEDLPEASFAGQQATFLNVQGEGEVIDAVKECWASLFEPRAIFYRAHQGYDQLKVGMAVPVQRMVQADTAGVTFTVEPVTSDPDKVVVEAIYGLGEAIVSGAVTPDLYVLDKGSLAILEKTMNRQDWKLVRNSGAEGGSGERNARVPVADAERERQKLEDRHIIALAEIAKRIEKHYGVPQDIEWAKEGEEVYIVQTRPVTTFKKVEGERGEALIKEIAGKVLLSGFPASPGAASGPVNIIFSAAQIGEVLVGDVLVTDMTTPDFVPAMKRVAAIVTNQGGRTCHAAIVSRELGVPCVVGTGNATKVLWPKQTVTVDGTWGKVFEGVVVLKKTEEKKAPSARIKTKTKLYVNLAEPELAEKVAARDVDGVGLLRAEFIVAHIGEHPRYAISQGRGEEFIGKLVEGLVKFASAFYPRPVVYRTTDFKTNEYRHLRGGELYEGEEENPMIGYRGASRYVGELDVFKLEIEAIKQVRRKYDNLWVMIPFVRTVEEMAQTKKILAANGLRRSKTFKLWMMVEVPSNIFLLDKFLDVGIDAISIGSNDLTQLILGIDRDNPKLATTFDERNPAVMMALERAIKTCKERGVSASICGQAPSVYPELTRKLVEWGITSVSVSPDMIEKTREIIGDAERRLARLLARGKLVPSNV